MTASTPMIGATELPGSAFAYTYNNAGNLFNDGAAAYTYDALSPTTVRGATTYAYNGDGTLVSQATGGVTTRYTQDLAAPLSQVLQTQVGAATRTDYIYGLNRLASLNSGVKTWYAADALGSVRRTVTDAGTPLGVTNYDPWGTPESGTVPTFGFTGEVQDIATGLVNLRARWYSTVQGRFTSVDPFAGAADTPYSLHQYAYGLSDPVLNTDPSGQASRSDDGGGIGREACQAIGWLWVVTYETNQGRCIPRPPLPGNELPRQPRPTPRDTDPESGRRVPSRQTGLTIEEPGIEAPPAPAPPFPVPPLEPEDGPKQPGWPGGKIGIGITGVCIAIITAAFADALGGPAPSRPPNDPSPTPWRMSIFRPGNDMPQTTQHIIDAIAAGKRSVVTYRGAGNRYPSGWLASQPACQGRSRTLWCDEYPFATVDEGGQANNPSLRLLPAREQRRQAGKWSRFLEGCKVAKGEKVVIEPSIAFPTTTWKCK